MWQTLTLFHDTPEGMMAHHQFQPELFVVSNIAHKAMWISVRGNLSCSNRKIQAQRNDFQTEAS